jgi:hypothetical protein
MLVETYLSGEEMVRIFFLSWVLFFLAQVPQLFFVEIADSFDFTLMRTSVRSCWDEICGGS